MGWARPTGPRSIWLQTQQTIVGRSPVAVQHSLLPWACTIGSICQKEVPACGRSRLALAFQGSSFIVLILVKGNGTPRLISALCLVYPRLPASVRCTQATWAIFTAQKTLVDQYGSSHCLGTTVIKPYRFHRGRLLARTTGPGVGHRENNWRPDLNVLFSSVAFTNIFDLS